MKKENITYISLLIALFVALFGNNIFQQITGISIFTYLNQLVQPLERSSRVSTPNIVISDTPAVDTFTEASSSATATPTAPAETFTENCSSTDIFRSIWNEHRTELGCSRGGPQVGNITVEAFEKGYLIWIEAEMHQIYGLFNDDHQWSIYPNKWEPGDDDFSCEAAKLKDYPVMGFGELWCNNASVNEQLGVPQTKETPDPMAERQFFEGGQIIQVYNSKIYILFDAESRRWVLR